MPREASGGVAGHLQQGAGPLHRVWSVCKAQARFSAASHPTEVLQNSMALPWLQTSEGSEGIVWLHATPLVLEPGLVEK